MLFTCTNEHFQGVLIPCNVINSHHEEHEGHEEKTQGCVVHTFLWHIWMSLQQYIQRFLTITAISF